MRGKSLIVERLYPSGGVKARVPIVAAATGVLNVAPRSLDLLTLMVGVSDVSHPRTNATYRSPFWLSAGSDPCWTVPLIAAATTTGAPHVTPPSCDATTSICP